jgi:PKD repeat protein
VTNQNTITQNSIHDNGNGGVTALGIDLAPLGQVNNAGNADPDANDAMLPPTLSAVTPLSVNASTCASCTVELFYADEAAGQFGSGSTYLQTATANASGDATFLLQAADAGHVLTATATNTSGSTSEFARNVQVPGTILNQPPKAEFTPTCTGLDCSFNGSASSDPDGTIKSYSWDFGDGSPVGTTQTVEHDYTAPGTYQVSLTVTDDQNATNTQTQSVMVTDLPPTAAFTGACNALACSFDGSSSSDPDNSISTYTWQFGDGSPTGSGKNVQHTYAQAGDYTVALTVDDGEGGTDSTSQVFHVTAATTSVVASDTFSRTVASGWGSADVGGAYAVATGASSGVVSVNGSAGSIKLTASPSGRGFYLPGVSVLDSDSLVDVSSSVVPAGGTYGQVGYVTARRVSANTEYRVRLRLLPNKTVHLSFVKTVGNTTEVMIGSDVRVAALTDAAGEVFHLRFDVTGSSPTTLQAKVWTGASEPAGWQLTATDGQAALQVAGNPGLRSYLGASASNTPIFLFDNYKVRDIS